MYTSAFASNRLYSLQIHLIRSNFIYYYLYWNGRIEGNESKKKIIGQLSKLKGFNCILADCVHSTQKQWTQHQNHAKRQEMWWETSTMTMTRSGSDEKIEKRYTMRERKIIFLKMKKKKNEILSSIIHFRNTSHSPHSFWFGRLDARTRAHSNQ